MVLRLLRVALGVPSPSLVHMLRFGMQPRSRTWLDRLEVRTATRWLAANPPPPELLQAEQEAATAISRMFYGR